MNDPLLNAPFRHGPHRETDAERISAQWHIAQHKLEAAAAELARAIAYLASFEARYRNALDAATTERGSR